MASTWEIVRHRASLYGQAKDARTGEPLAGVCVEITAGPPAFASRLALLARQHGNGWATLNERTDRTRTAWDGFFRFLDLPAGEYTLTGTLPTFGTRYGAASAQIVLSADDQGSAMPGTADLSLSATVIQGSINTEGKGAVRLAEVRVQGSGERAWSDAQGCYVLSGVEIGTRKLTVSVRGLRVRLETVTIGQAGELVTCNVNLSPL